MIYLITNVSNINLDNKDELDNLDIDEDRNIIPEQELNITQPVSKRQDPSDSEKNSEDSEEEPENQDTYVIRSSGSIC